MKDFARLIILFTVAELSFELFLSACGNFITKLLTSRMLPDVA